MPFAEIPERLEFESNFKKPVWMKLDQGQYIIRIAQANAHMSYRHWVNGASVECLDDGCPVCENNAQIRAEHPDDFRNVKGYSPRSTRFSVNVLDLTPALTCPACKEKTLVVGGKPPKKCEHCNKFFPDDVTPEPLGEVKILDRGVRLFEQLNSLEETVNDPYSALFDKNNPTKTLRDFDIALVVTGQGSNKVTTPLPLLNNNAPVEVSEDDLYNLEDAVLHLYRDEMILLMGGVSIRDILKARSADDSDVVESERDSASADVEEAIRELGYELEG